MASFVWFNRFVKINIKENVSTEMQTFETKTRLIKWKTGDIPWNAAIPYLTYKFKCNKKAVLINCFRRD